MIGVYIAMVFAFPHVPVATLASYPTLWDCEASVLETRVAPGQWVECHYANVPAPSAPYSHR
jgi:hypothetical protein